MEDGYILVPMCSVIDQIMFLLLGLKSSAGNPLPVEKGPGSIAPLRAELWPFKEGTRQKKRKLTQMSQILSIHFQTRISQA